MINGPIVVSAPGKSLQGAVGSDITFNTRWPFAKLDTTNKVSFQNINIFFATDPPNPNGTTVFSQKTVVYTFPHGYKYIPAIWCIFQRNGNGDQGDFSVTKYGPYGYENGLICVSSTSDFAQSANLTLTADATNIYISVTKNYRTGGGWVDPPVNLSGYSLLVRVYAFVNDLSGTDVPSQA
jgi:hypothetical protein